MTTRFLLADHLGALARWLRLLGYDAAVYRQLGFAQLIHRAAKERRVYLTRSPREADDHRPFPRRLVHGQKALEQLASLREVLSLDEGRLFSRCSVCNVHLRALPRARAAQLVPPHVFETQEDFRYCPRCGRVYWAGTHEQEARERLRKIFAAPTPVP